MREQLEAWIGGQLGEPVTVTSLRRITTGHSRANWRLELADGSCFVVRVEQGGVFGTSGAAEFEFMGAVARLGFPVAQVRWLEPTGTVLGQPFFVMDFVDGGVAAEREDRTLAPELAVDFVRRLHELHGLDWSGELDGPPPGEAIHVQIERWADVYRSSSPTVIPLLDEGCAWLHRHAPELPRVSLVHGDPGPGNFVHDGRRVLAFTDWEFSHLGDPTEDWAFLLSMRGVRTMPHDAWLELIRRETGVEVGDAQMHYWRVFNFFKGACANASCLRAFAGANPAPNMLLIGTVLQQTFMRQMADLVGVVVNAHDLRWPDLVWSHFSRPRFGGFDERVAAAAAAGFAGLGLYIDEYRRLRDDEGRSAADIGRQLDDHGLVLSDIEVLTWWALGDEVAARGREQEELAWELADGAACRYVQAIGPYVDTTEQAGEAFAALCDRAAAHDLLVGIEWLPFTNIATAADAAEIVDIADRRNGGYCADIWHHRRGADDEAMLRALDAGKVFAVQMNDGALARVPIDEYKADCLANRVPPGEGEFDCAGFVRLLAEMGVSCPISLEVCSTELWAAPAAEAARRSADGMREVLAQAGAS